MTSHIIKKISLITLLLSNLFSLHAATHDGKPQTAQSTFSYTAGIAAATAIIGGYTLASYTGILPTWLPSPIPLLEKIQERLTNNPKSTLVFGCALTAESYILYKVAYRLRAEHILGSLPPIGQASSHQLSEADIAELSAFGTANLDKEYEFASFEFPLQTPSFVRIMGSIPQEESIPSYAHDIIRQATRNVGISRPIFFHQTTLNDHACAFPFNRIGLHPRTLAFLNPENLQIFDRATIPFITEADFAIHTMNSLKAIYHELCHIKEQHSLKNSSVIYKTLHEELDNNLRTFITDMLYTGIINHAPATTARIAFVSKFLNSSLPTDAQTIYNLRRTPEAQLGASYYLKCLNTKIEKIMLAGKLLNSSPPINADVMYHLYQEMEAELGAIYYVKRFHDFEFPATDFYMKDDDHPAPTDQQRYNRLLLQQLDNDPNADYTIIKKIAKAYLLETEPRFADFFALQELAAEMKPAAASSSQ